MTKQRGKKEEATRERGRVLSPHSLTSLHSCFFPAHFSLHPMLSECLEQAILVLEDSSVTAIKKDIKTFTIWFKGAELRSFLNLTDQIISSRVTIKCKKLGQLLVCENHQPNSLSCSWMCWFICWLLDSLGHFIVCFDRRHHWTLAWLIRICRYLNCLTISWIPDKQAKKSRIPCLNFGVSRCVGSSQNNNPISCQDILPSPESRTIFWSNSRSQKYPSRPWPARTSPDFVGKL